MSIDASQLRRVFIYLTPPRNALLCITKRRLTLRRLSVAMTRAQPIAKSVRIIDIIAPLCELG